MPPDLRPPRGLPARSPSALRASLGASSRSPARPRHRPPAPRQIPPSPSTPVGPGCLVCPWAAARPLAVRAAWRCLWPHGCSGRRRARPPARLGGLTSFGAAPRSPPVPSGPAGALHTSGTWSLMCGWVLRLKAWPGPATAHGHRSRVLRFLRRPTHQWGWVCWRVAGCVGSLSGYGSKLAISHAIPPRPFQILKLDRWNCSVF